MTEIIKIFGGPGAGKTTTAVGNEDIEGFTGILERKFESGNVQDTMLIAYTRSAAEEAKGRLNNLTSINKSALDKRITTIHSLTMGMTGIYPKKIVEISNVPHKYHFCNEQDVVYKQNNSDDDDFMDVPDDPGHQFFQMLSWLKSNMKPINEWQDCPISGAWNNEQHDIQELFVEWRAFKNGKGIYEFDDVIREAVDEGYTIDANELFVDEVQDLYPLQQAFVDNQMDVIDRLWLAGDDDQTIYEWAGADPSYFIEMDGKVDSIDKRYWNDKEGYWDEDGVYILDQSFRMPKKILDLSQRCIEKVDDRQSKELKPMGQGGSVDYLSFPSTNQLVDHINMDDTFILCRANYQCSNVGQDLIQEGIPFTDRFKTWREMTVDIRDVVAALFKDEEYVSGDKAARLLSEVDSNQVAQSNSWGGLEDEFRGESRAEVDRLKELLRGRRVSNKRRLGELIDSIDEFNYYQREAIKKNVFRGKDHLDPDGITIETIHWSKGQEADTVILALNSAGSVGVSDPESEKSMPDAERRLYYVGMTRAKNNLVLAQSLDHASPSFSGKDLFGEDWGELVGLDQ